MKKYNKKELISEIKKLINIEFTKQYINSISCSENAITKFEKYYENSSLNENLSVYKNIQYDANLIFDLIIKKYINKEYTTQKVALRCAEGYYVPIDKFYIYLDFPIKDLNRVNVNIYKFNNESDVEHNYQKKLFKNSFLVEDNCINANMYMVGDNIYTVPFFKTLSHELRHFYDIKIFNISNSAKSKMLYKASLNILKNVNYNDKNINHKIAFMVYFTSKPEVLANCQGIYNELKTKYLTDIKLLPTESNIYHEICVCNNFFNEFKENKIDVSNYNKELFCGLEFTQMMIYLETNIKYCNSKICKAVTKWFSDKVQNESYDFGIDIMDFYPIKDNDKTLTEIFKI